MRACFPQKPSVLRHNRGGRRRLGGVLRQAWKEQDRDDVSLTTTTYWWTRNRSCSALGTRANVVSLGGARRLIRPTWVDEPNAVVDDPPPPGLRLTTQKPPENICLWQGGRAAGSNAPLVETCAQNDLFDLTPPRQMWLRRSGAIRPRTVARTCRVATSLEINRDIEWFLFFGDSRGRSDPRQQYQTVAAFSATRLMPPCLFLR